MGKVNYYLSKHADQDGMHLILLQYAYDGNQKLLSSFKRKVKKKHWDYEEKRVKKVKAAIDSGEYDINPLLDGIKNELESQYKTLRKNGIPTPAMLREHIKRYIDPHASAKEKKQDIWTLIHRFKDGSIKSKVNQQSKSEMTRKIYGVLKSRLESFQKNTGTKVSFENVDGIFCEKFIQHMYKNKLSQNTIHKTMKVLKSIMNRAVFENLTTNQRFKDSWVTIPEVPVEAVALSRAEIKQLFDHDFSYNKTYEAVRDLFVFGCHTGLRYGDYSQVQPHNIITVNGKKRIRMMTGKTKVIVEIPCHLDVIKIFDKYKDNPNHLPYTISQQRFNDYIKIIGKEAGLTETGRILGSDVKPMHEVPLYSLISSHTARRTCLTNLYKEGIPIAILMKISGHKTETAFLRYIKITVSEGADKLEQHYEKLEKESKKLKVVA